MKFTFKIQQYQTEAVASLVDCFEGQLPANGVQYLRDKGLMPKLVKEDVQTELFEKQKTEDEQLEESDTGYRNADLILSDKELLDNIHKIQDRNFIIHSEKIEKTANSPSFDIEMETGTGKTYVYIKTMFELNKRYGWSKFIVVVPSIAIRENSGFAGEC